MPTETPTRTVETDVLVAGAGPGGATLAYLLARSDADVRLVERQTDLAREFRGYLFQPLALRVFRECGLLEEVLALDHVEVAGLDVRAYGRSYRVSDFTPFGPGFALLMEQPPLLRLLIEEAEAYEGFAYRDGTTVEDLTRDERGRVTGAVARDRAAGERVRYDADLVIGADGRYSTVREAAGIDPGLFESSVELVWFKLPREAVPSAAQFTFGPGGLVLYFGLGRAEGQAGVFVPEGAYASLREAGIDAFRERLAAADPGLAGALRESVSDFSDCSLLRIAPGFAERWTGDGLLLLGDAAHVASPVGGQGNSLAIQDAVLAHPAVLGAVRARDGPVPRTALRAWEEVRREDVRSVLKTQRRGERFLSAYVRNRERVPRAVERAVLRAALGTVSRVGVPESALRPAAMGPRGGDHLRVASEYFVD